MEFSNSEPPTQDMETGTVVGDFKIRQLLGIGGCSRVYLANQISLDRPVALKITQASTHEGILQAALEHENIVPVYSEQESGDHCLIAMPYIPGITLSELLEALADESREKVTRKRLLELIRSRVAEKNPSADWEVDTTLGDEPFFRAACDIILQMASAFRFAHDREIVHRDVKPENILIDVNGRAFLIDFNVAMRTKAIPSAEPAVIGGTLPYMSPEQLMEISGDDNSSGSEVGARTDIYSLGIVFYELVTGFRPFQLFESEGTRMAVARKMWAERIQGPPVFPASKNAVPSDLSAIITKCLQPNASDRYESAADVIEDIERFLQSLPLRFARDPRHHERIWKWMRKHIWASVGIILCMALPFIFVAGDYGALSLRLRQAEREVGELTGSQSHTVESLWNAERSVLECRSLFAYSNLRKRRARLLHDLGLLFARNENFERSVGYFHQAVETDPHLGEAWSNLGVVYYRLRQIDEALDAFDEAIRLGYNDAEVLANRGAARFIAGDFSGATEDLNAAIRKNPDSPAAKRNLELLEKHRE